MSATGKPPLGSAARPRRERLSDGCTRCGGTGLWSNWFTPEGDGSDGSRPGDRWLTLCSDCSTFFA